MDYSKAKKLAESTKVPKFVKVDEQPYRQSEEDAKTERLCKKWDGLLKSRRAIDRKKIQRGHGVPDSQWEGFFNRNFLNDDGRIFGKDFFVYPDGRMCCLVEIDDAIANDNIELVLGKQAEKFEGRNHPSQQEYADDWETDDDGKTVYFKRGSGRGSVEDIYTQ